MLTEGIEIVSEKANGSKLKRFASNPFKYVFALAYRLLIFRFLKKPFYTRTKTFWDEPFLVALPAAMDIYLTGGKTDDSEIRLAKFMIKSLRPGDFFIDIGSHFGYFSLLALKCLKGKGIVLAIEPAKEAFKILKENLKNHSSATAINCLAGAKDSHQDFYEFPSQQSEYNTAYPEQFEETDWYKKTLITRTTIPCRSIDSLLSSYEQAPGFIKIDAEGSELEVIKGAGKLVSESKDLIIVMEMLSKNRKNEAHLEAVEVLEKFNYKLFVITPEGDLEPCNNVENHLLSKGIDSDNIVFKYGV